VPLKTALIRQRIADFLKFHQPFELFSETLQLALASAGRGPIALPFAIFFKSDAGKLYVAR
jgi:hypothetical protein